ncbi:MAG: DUF86 domain-containing protein [Candidatus Aenigmarchaeota archaeon]|nr:DUF86 domain-containing protein [Candidatus Aenigmarchaeota archaeon]
MEEKRYRQKLNELENRLEFLKGNLSWKEEFISNRMLKKACYKEFQEAVEIVSDILAMIVKDSGKAVEDDYTNIEIVSKVLNSSDIKSGLRSAHGLRNILVHEYNEINDELAFDSILENIEVLKKFADMAKEWLRKT